MRIRLIYLGLHIYTILLPYKNNESPENWSKIDTISDMEIISLNERLLNVQI